jgi:general nucleoside transport system ATP-binding protein
LGIAGVAGNGQRELAEVICGLRATTGGVIRVDGSAMKAAAPRQMIEAGIAYVPEDRNHTGSAPNLTVAENMALKSYRQPGIGRGALIHPKTMRSSANDLIKGYAISTPSSETPARKLSGGNLQKVILAREISGKPKVLVAASPTRGLDIGATESVRKILLEERTAGSAILLISEDLDEIFAISDRIAVIYEGRIMGEFPASEADLGTVGLLMAGGEKEQPAEPVTV